MILQDDPTQAQALVPPRPNLGPEPWSQPVGRPGMVLPGLLAITAFVGFLWWRRRRISSVPATGSQALTELGPEPEPLSPRARWVALSESIRSKLIAAHGPGWGSKTTEEVADEPTLADRWGPEPSKRLVEVLRIADRAKFAGDEPEPIEEWEAWAASLVPIEPVVTNSKSSVK